MQFWCPTVNPCDGLEEVALPVFRICEACCKPFRADCTVFDCSCIVPCMLERASEKSCSRSGPVDEIGKCQPDYLEIRVTLEGIANHHRRTR